MRSKLIVALFAAAAICATSVPALAADPAGGCPTGYELFQLPPLPEAPAGHAVDARGNQDGYICFKAYPNPDHPGGFNLIDNRVQSGN